MQNISISGAQMNVYGCVMCILLNVECRKIIITTRTIAHRMETAEKDIEIEERKKIEKREHRMGQYIKLCEALMARSYFQIIHISFFYLYAYAEA